MNSTALPRVLILSSAETQESVPLNDEFIRKLRESIGDEIHIEWCNYHALQIEFKTGDIKVWHIPSGLELREFDFVYYKSFFRYSELAGVIATYLDATNTSYVSSELRNHIPLTKLSQLSRLALANLPIAQTLFMLHEQWKLNYSRVVELIGSPFIFKSTDGSGGDENFLIHSEQAFYDALDKFPDLQFIAQKYIPNDSDLRVLIVGDEIKLVIKRQRADDKTHLNNTSQGADAVIIPLSELSLKDREIALRSAQIMQREIAGVDLLFELKTNDPYILEVNASPQIASGAFTDKKLEIYRDYFVDQAKKAHLKKVRR